MGMIRTAAALRTLAIGLAFVSSLGASSGSVGVPPSLAGWIAAWLAAAAVVSAVLPSRRPGRRARRLDACFATASLAALACALADAWPETVVGGFVRLGHVAPHAAGLALFVASLRDSLQAHRPSDDRFLSLDWTRRIAAMVRIAAVARLASLAAGGSLGSAHLGIGLALLAWPRRAVVVIASVWLPLFPLLFDDAAFPRSARIVEGIADGMLLLAAARRSRSSGDNSRERPNGLTRSIERIGAAALGVAAIAMGYRLSFLEGIVRPIEVSGVSMLPHWTGEHDAWTCQACRFAFRRSASDGVLQTACPNCNTLTHRPDTARRRPADRVVIDRWNASHPRRWDVFAIRDRADPSYWEFKRIVGLPGERLELRDGQVRIDGRVAAKSFTELRACAVLVHDDAFSAPSRPPRWSTRADPSVTGRVWHSFAFAGDRPTPVPAPSRDGMKPDAPLSVGTPMATEPVRDVLLRCELSTRGKGALTWTYERPTGQIAWRITVPDGTWELVADGTTRAEGSAPPGSAREPRMGVWEFAVWDQQVALAVNGTTIAVVPLWETAPRTPDDARPVSGPRLAVGVEGLGATFRRRRVFRDLAHDGPDGRDVPWSLPNPLTDDQVLVLGDNSSASLDGRQRGPTDRHDLLGRVVRWSGR